MEAEKVTQEIREAFAEEAHLTWQRWMAYMLTNLNKEHIERWTRQADTAYKGLPESEKASDIAIADRRILMLKNRGDIKILDEKELPIVTGFGIGGADVEQVNLKLKAQEDMLQWHKDSLKDFVI